MFGHVGAESLMFMTPVILDSYHPFLEFFPTDAVRISDSKQTIYEEYKNIIELHPDMKKAKNLVMERYSPIESAKRLMKITG